ncbi:MAG: DUF1573 domain-containing protein [Planctomycetota bacterium]
MHANRTTLALAFCLALSASASGQEWANKMFEKRDHDFKAVARGADTVYRFEVTNIYKEDIHLASVRSSCGCTTPSIENNTIKTYEKGYIVAKFNTRTFTGLHSATLTVTIDRPYPAQVQLRVHGNIRGDVVFEPGSINFGSVEQGKPVEKSVAVTYAGYSGWRIQDVRSASSDLEVELGERPRSGGRAAYNLTVRLKPTAKPGFLKEQLVIVTSDQSNPRIPLDVEGRVVPEISVAPAKLLLGSLPLGETVTKRLIVRGKQPFSIEKIECQAAGFAFKAGEEPNDRHIIEIAFTPQSGAGYVKTPIVIHTSLGDTYQAQCMAYATLLPSAEPTTPTEATPAEPTAQETAADAGANNAAAAGGTPEEERLASDR